MENQKENKIYIVVDVQPLGVGIPDTQDHCLAFVSVQQVKAQHLGVGAGEVHLIVLARGHDSVQGADTLLARVPWRGQMHNF